MTDGERRVCPHCGEVAFEDQLADGSWGLRCSSCGRVTTIFRGGAGTPLPLKAWLMKVRGPKTRKLDKGQ